MAGVYLLRITDKFTKVGRSDNLEKRLDYWRSHAVQIGWKKELTWAESHLLEFAILRANERASERQVTAFMRRQPLFPCSRLSVPQGCSEWICSDMARSRQQVELFLPVVQDLTEGIADKDWRALDDAKAQIRAITPRADGRVDHHNSSSGTREEPMHQESLSDEAPTAAS